MVRDRDPVPYWESYPLFYNLLFWSDQLLIKRNLDGRESPVYQMVTLECHCKCINNLTGILQFVISVLKVLEKLTKLFHLGTFHVCEFQLLKFLRSVMRSEWPHPWKAIR